MKRETIKLLHKPPQPAGMLKFLLAGVDVKNVLFFTFFRFHSYPRS